MFDTEFTEDDRDEFETRLAGDYECAVARFDYKKWKRNPLIEKDGRFEDDWKRDVGGDADGIAWPDRGYFPLGLAGWINPDAEGRLRPHFDKMWGLFQSNFEGSVRIAQFHNRAERGQMDWFLN